MDDDKKIEGLSIQIEQLKTQLEKAHNEIIRLKLLMNGYDIMKNSLGPNYPNQ